MNILTQFSRFVMPIILFVFALILLFSKNNLADSFVLGAKEGAACCFNLLPSLLLIMCSVSALFSSGAVDLLCNILSPVFAFLGVPEEMMPSVVIRPFSGSGATVVADRIFSEYGADSLVSKTISILMGSTDTVVYTLGMYFSSANIKRTRYAIPASFIVYLFSIFVCVSAGKIML